MRIGPAEVGPGSPTFIIGEVGINHNGDLGRARALIDLASDSGCDAVKFQKRDLPSVYTDSVLNGVENHEQGFQYLIPILQDFELEPDAMAELKAYADSVGIEFLCTPFDAVSLAHLEAMGVPAYKIASADLTDFSLLEQVASLGKPMMLSTGMSTDDEIDRTVELLRSHETDFALLHCVSSYPVDNQEANITRIPALAERYGVPVGYSGHDLGTTLSVVAVSLGANIVEKHITLDRGLRGPDHKVSLLPEELQRLVAQIREVEQATGDGRNTIQQGELLNQLVFRKSVVAIEPIVAGQTIEREMLATRCPGTGLSPQRMGELVGRPALREMAVDEVFLATDLSAAQSVTLQLDDIPDFGTWGMVVRYHDFETVLGFGPKSLEFHLTHRDTTLEVPHEKLTEYSDVLGRLKLRVHCCEYVGERLFDLCSQYLDVRAASLGTLQRVIDITSELSEYFDEPEPHIVVNVGAMSLRREVRDTKVDAVGLYEAISSLNLRNTKIMMQNMPPNPWYFGGQWKGHYFLRTDELIDFCEETGQFVCLDLSHAQMTCNFTGEDFGEYVAALKPYVRHLHLADATGIEGEGVQVGQGDVDFDAFFEIYRDYEGTWIPEIWQGHVNGHVGAVEGLRALADIHRRVLAVAASAR